MTRVVRNVCATITDWIFILCENAELLSKKLKNITRTASVLYFGVVIVSGVCVFQSFCVVWRAFWQMRAPCGLLVCSFLKNNVLRLLYNYVLLLLLVLSKVYRTLIGISIVDIVALFSVRRSCVSCAEWRVQVSPSKIQCAKLFLVSAEACGNQKKKKNNLEVLELEWLDVRSRRLREYSREH